MNLPSGCLAELLRSSACGLLLGFALGGLLHACSERVLGDLCRDACWPSAGGLVNAECYCADANGAMRPVTP